MTTTPTPSQDPALPREAYTLLAQANLLRMRGRWDEAVEKCMAALRLAPESASAQSLLGDIYENQGRLDDAIQWYRMALDINPDSPADRLKLDRLLESRQRQLAALHPHSDYTPLSPIVVQVPPAPPARGLRHPETLLRWGAWLVAALTVLVVVLAGLAMDRSRRADEPQVKAAPVVLPAAAVNGPAPDAVQAADPSEQALLQALQQDAQMTAQNITPVGVQMDPRQSAITLTVLCPSPPAGASVRDGLLRDGLLALQAAGRAQGDRAPTSWTIRCLLAPAGSAPDAAPALAFVADTTPAALAALGPDLSSLSAAQMLPAFRNPWWSPDAPQ
ncbi:MAG: tetratricopeptide repeat protein [Armatimonadetes bacterium]|nr:tetratricopeptide repeat protein [Armatimonadota bacterium]